MEAAAGPALEQGFAIAEGRLQGAQTRLAPQRDNEREAIIAAGISLDEVLDADDLVRGPVIFAACGITGGTMLGAPRLTAGWISTQSLIVRPGSYRRIVESTPAPESNNSAGG